MFSLRNFLTTCVFFAALTLAMNRRAGYNLELNRAALIVNPRDPNPAALTVTNLSTLLYNLQAMVLIPPGTPSARYLVAKNSFDRLLAIAHSTISDKWAELERSGTGKEYTNRQNKARNALIFQNSFRVISNLVLFGDDEVLTLAAQKGVVSLAVAVLREIVNKVSKKLSEGDRDFAYKELVVNSDFHHAVKMLLTLGQHPAVCQYLRKPLSPGSPVCAFALV
ncbi:hypothetical protein ROZALSC1DRAFT_31911, partial [Rozella allomycis CSF55]